MQRFRIVLTAVALVAMVALPAGLAITAQHEGDAHDDHQGEHGKAEKAPMHEKVHANLGKALESIEAAEKAVEQGETQTARKHLQKAEKLLSGMREGMAREHGMGAYAYANAKCPIMGNKINPEQVTGELTRTFQGEKVAFCCAGCPAQWDKLSEQQKQAKLEKVAHPEPAKAEGDHGDHAEHHGQQTRSDSGVVNKRCPIMGGKVKQANLSDSLVRSYQGKKVGFCCGHCPAAWDKLSDEQKQARLEKAGVEVN